MTDAQLLIQEGREEGREEGLQQGMRQTLLRLGTRKFGPPDAATRSAIEGKMRLSDLERLLDEVLDAPDWKTLLSRLH